MKPALEHIRLKESQQSFKFFKIVTKAYTPYWHYHPELELTLILRGQGTRFIGDSILPFMDLDLVLVGKNVPHHWVSRESLEDQVAYVFQFSAEIFDPFTELMPLKSLFLRAKRGIQFKNLNQELVQEIQAFEHLNELERISALIRLLSQLEAYKSYELLASENYQARREKISAQLKFSKINNYILEHLDTKLTVSEVSKVAHMVPQSFCRWFKKHSGHSFISFVNITRVENACQLLLTTDMPIQDVAFSSGFESISHFNRTFKKIKGVSPREFRSLNQKIA
ncbi:MAG: AraC family transcriptional regulator [Bacteroidota bacterium]